MWLWLKENHPIIHEVVQWAVLAIAVAALVNSCIILSARPASDGAGMKRG